jgi:hypothetical protein
MAQDQAEQERAPRGGFALGLALAALAACWNPFAAPFGLVLGISAAVLGARALRRAGGRRRVPAVALAVGALAAAASVTVLLLTAGAVGVEIPGEPVVQGRTRAEVEKVLSEAGERTREQRERAGKELQRRSGAGSSQTTRAPARSGGSTAPGAADSDPP